MELVSGQNVVITKQNIDVVINYTKKSSCSDDVDASAFLISAEGKVRDSRDFIFYGQKISSDNSVALSLTNGSANFSVDTSKIHEQIDKIPLTIVMDGNSTINDLVSLSLCIDDVKYNVELANRTEKALIIAQLYRHNGGWKIKAMGMGFNGGLAPLANGYGVATSNEPVNTAPATPVVQTVSLSKKLEAKAPQLVHLAKTIEVNLQKHKLNEFKAKVVIALDGSGSMSRQYKGEQCNVQAVLDRITALAVQFDDNQSLDIWGFATKFKKFPDVTLDNLSGYINKIKGNRSWDDIFQGLGGTNNEPPVMMDIIKTFEKSKEPVVIYFVTDGGINRNKEIKQAIALSAHLPIYWKFVGLGGRNYGVLEELDKFKDRVIDNTDFFAIDDFKTIKDNDLYDKLLSEINNWLKEAKEKSIFTLN